ncbi:MAG: NAD(P)H-hydrate dehydratase [Melioribacteraceae bacterium]|nr:NAD(P)H-hydrate dehydratase [Melioribacteraceae bacterium]
MIPLYSAQQVREADSYAINTLAIPSIVLMENASRSIFEAISKNLDMETGNKTIGIICGKGNNGGDGFALARHFLNNEFIVRIISLGAEEELKGDALINFRITKNLLNEHPQSKLIVFENIKEISLLEDCHIIIDAMLGTGSRGELTEPYKEIVTRVNQLNTYKVAVDLPTGLDLENSSGEFIFNADLTITLSEYKTGLFYGRGYTNSGTIKKGYIGIGVEYYKNLPVANYLIEPEDAFYGIPSKELDLNKYSAGKILVIAGSSKMPGASFFTSNSVLKAGAGSCFLASPKSIKTLAQQKVDAAIVIDYDDNMSGILSPHNVKEIEEKINWADVIAIGPGLGREPETKEAVLEILRAYKSKKFVIDADAIIALANDEYKKINLKGKVLTPHHKEFAKLLGIELIELNKNILELGRGFAVDNNCFLVLKGAPTIIFNPAGESFINSSGNPGLAKFGSGDVLTGVIAGFISQTSEIEDSLIAAVYIHSLAADLLLDEKSELGYTASDLMDRIPYAIKFIIDSFI